VYFDVSEEGKESVSRVVSSGLRGWYSGWKKEVCRLFGKLGENLVNPGYGKGGRVRLGTSLRE
jgi:hypothetical protein